MVFQFLCSTLNKCFCPFFPCVLANCRSSCVPPEEITLQPFCSWMSPAVFWQLEPPHHHICQRWPWWRFAVSDGILLHDVPHLSKVCGNPSVCNSDWSVKGQYPWERHHRLIQNSHDRVETFYWEVELFQLGVVNFQVCVWIFDLKAVLFTLKCKMFGSHTVPQMSYFKMWVSLFWCWYMLV